MGVAGGSGDSLLKKSLIAVTEVRAAECFSLSSRPGLGICSNLLSLSIAEDEHTGAGLTTVQGVELNQWHLAATTTMCDRWWVDGSWMSGWE
jgi:hypothetical protein